MSAPRPPTSLVLTILAPLLAASIAVALAFGSEPLPVADAWSVVRAHLIGGQVDATTEAIVWDLRLPRTLLAATAGCGLAVAGAGMQTLVRNPLADPYLLGISSGAGVGATAVIATGFLAGLGVWSLSLGALMGALGAALLVFGIAQAQGGLTPLRLVLTGVVLSSAFSAVSSFMVFWSADPRAAQSVLFWLLGSVAGGTWDKLPPAAIVTAVVSLMLVVISRWLDALASGPEVARSLGVPVDGLRRGLFAGLSILVGVIVAVSGGIGFVGLVVPHLARMVVGARHRAVLPVAGVFGALFLVWVDVLSRVAVRPQDIPLSVVTGVIGAPVFLLVVGRRHYRYGGQD